MNIVIAGAGEVGTHLAKLLSESKNNNIVLIDSVDVRLKNVSEQADVLTIFGESTSISVLKSAGIQKTDLFIAVNSSHDMNIASSIMAKHLGVKKVICRVDNGEYLLPENKEMFNNLGIDILLYPENTASQEIINLLERTGASEYIDFSGRLQLMAIRLEEGASIVDATLRDTNKYSENNFRIVAIDRGNDTIIMEKDERLKLHDMVYFITLPEGVPKIMRLTNKTNIEVERVMIMGGGPIALMVAKELEKDTSVKLIEADKNKCKTIADSLINTLVINTDYGNIEALMEEGLGDMDAFVALTDSSETNILACIAARRAGVKKTIAEIENIDYIRLAESLGVDTVVNKKIIAASRIFRFTSHSEVLGVKYLAGSEAEIMEFIVKPNSPATRTKVKFLNFPHESSIAGVIRGNKSFIVDKDTELQAYDKVTVLVLPKAIHKVGEYFQ